MNISVTHPGKIGDCLYALPTIRHIAQIHGQPVDFWTSQFCEPLRPLFEKQKCIKSFNISTKYKAENDGCGIQPWTLEPDKPCDKLYELGLRNYPNTYLADYYPPIYGFTNCDTTIKYDFETKKKFGDVLINENDFNIVVCCGRNEQLRPWFGAFLEMAEQLPIQIYQVGPESELLGPHQLKNTKNLALNMYETVQMLSNANLYVGTLSANLVLANGFDIPKLILAEPNRWQPRHDLHTDKHHYLGLPTSPQRFLNIIYGYYLEWTKEDQPFKGKK